MNEQRMQQNTTETYALLTFACEKKNISRKNGKIFCSLLLSFISIFRVNSLWMHWTPSFEWQFFLVVYLRFFFINFSSCSFCDSGLCFFALTFFFVLFFLFFSCFFLLRWYFSCFRLYISFFWLQSSVKWLLFYGTFELFSTKSKEFSCFSYFWFVFLSLFSANSQLFCMNTFIFRRFRNKNFVENYCLRIFYLNFFSIIHTVNYFTFFFLLLFTCLNHRFFTCELRNLPTGRKKVFVHVMKKNIFLTIFINLDNWNWNEQHSDVLKKFWLEENFL